MGKIFSNNSKVIYHFPECNLYFYLFIYYALVGECVGRGTLHLYELVGEPYISMYWWGNVYNSMQWSELVSIRGINVRGMPVR